MDQLTLNFDLTRMAVSQFQDFEFNGFAKWDSKYIATGANGIYEIESGSTDDQSAIHSRFDLPVTDLGHPNQKRIRRIYANGKFWGQIVLKLKDDDNNEQSFPLIPEKANGKQCTAIANVSTGAGRNWQISVESFGVDFTIDSMSALVINTRQKR